MNANATEILLMVHVLFGLGCMIAAIWVFVEVLNASEANLGRIRWASRAAAVCMWLALLAGGYWYVVYYPADKAVILKGPWPAAHNYFMESKEHLVILLVLLATYLPMVAANNLAANRPARRLALSVAALIVLTALMMDGHGALIAMGVKMGLLGKT
jgi:hypothetical protein